MEKWWKENPISREDVIASSNEPDRLPEDWIDRVRFYTNLDPEKIPQAEKELTERFLENIPVHRDKRERNLGLIQNYIDTLYPDTLLVCGEGVSYIGNDKLLFEEKCPQYWELMRQTARRYREFGLWGTVVRTCCGPEDPVWYQWAEELKKVNEAFLKGE